MKPTDSDTFDQWYSLYPIKKAKQNALKSWKRQKLDERADELIEILSNQIKYDKQWKAGYGIPHPSTYLNQARWEDEIEYEKPKQRTKAERFADSLFGACDESQTGYRDLGALSCQVWTEVDGSVGRWEDEQVGSGRMVNNFERLDRRRH